MPVSKPVEISCKSKSSSLVLGLARITTGIENLDTVLYGGLPTLSVNIITGEPGTGKTVLALQTLFNAARQGQKCIYFTTLSEPSVKLIRMMQLFAFFDLDQVRDHVVFADLGSVMRERGPQAALAALTERVEEEDPTLVVVDSFKALHDMIKPGERRAFIYDLSVGMIGWGATTLLVGEYTEHERITLSAFAIADGIIQLRTVRSELNTIRELEVRKLRGSGYVAGSHYFDINSQGIDFVPRVHAPQVPTATARPAAPVALEQATTGVLGLDEILSGGWPKGSTTIVVGGTGTGKTILGMEFLREGARLGEPGLILALEEDSEQLRATARGFGWDLQALEDQGLLTIHYTTPIELSTDRFLQEARSIIESSRARRLVLDSLTSLGLGAITDKRFRELVYALTKHLRAAGVTSQLNLEVSELLGSGRLSAHGLSFAADNVLYVRYVEVHGRLDRAAVVIKSRGIDHSSELHELVITGEGLKIKGAIRDLQGVLTGLPSPFLSEP